jgi:hypothetical protein
MQIHLQDVVVKVDIELYLVFEESQSLTFFLGFCFPTFWILVSMKLFQF